MYKPPRSIVFLHCLSLFNSFAILAFAFFDLGALSLFLSPCFAVLTVMYHTVVLLLLKKRPDLPSALCFPAVFTAYFLSTSWLGTFIVMFLVSWHNEAQIKAFWLNAGFPAGETTTQTLQFLFVALEFAILGDLGVRSTVFWRMYERQYTNSD